MTGPLLLLEDLRASAEAAAPLSLTLASDELVLVETTDAAAAAAIGDCCLGLAPPEAGTLRYQGRDWAALPPPLVEALRGRIGRVPAAGGWLPHVSVAENILLPLLYHTPEPEAALCEQAAELARAFGLPGLPLGRPASLPAGDLLRAACVRAFLGAPLLLLLEIGFEAMPAAELLPPLLGALGAARARGAGCLWFTGLPRLLRDPAIPAARRIALHRGEAPA